MDLVIGGGKFGCKAIEYLIERGRNFVVIDMNPECEAVKRFDLEMTTDTKHKGRYFIQGDISKVLELIETLKPELVFPTAPIHIAAELARVKFNLKPWIEEVDRIIAGIPAKVIVSCGKGTVVVSYNRDKKCLENCPAPDICPVTKIKKPCPMYDLISFAYPDAFVLISEQLKPGLGALKGRDLIEFLEFARDKQKFVVATSCKCHGVITALTR